MKDPENGKNARSVLRRAIGIGFALMILLFASASAETFGPEDYWGQWRLASVANWDGWLCDASECKYSGMLYIGDGWGLLYKDNANQSASSANLPVWVGFTWELESGTMRATVKDNSKTTTYDLCLGEDGLLQMDSAYFEYVKPLESKPDALVGRWSISADDEQIIHVQRIQEETNSLFQIVFQDNAEWYIYIPDPLIRDITFDGYDTPKGGWFVWNDRFYLYICESNELREFSYTLSGDTLSLSFLQTVDYNARLHAAEGNPQFENVFLDYGAPIHYDIPLYREIYQKNWRCMLDVNGQDYACTLAINADGTAVYTLANRFVQPDQIYVQQNLSWQSENDWVDLAYLTYLNHIELQSNQKNQAGLRIESQAVRNFATKRLSIQSLTATVEVNGESIEAVLTEMPELDAFLTSIDENGIDAARYMGQWQAKGCAANECTADVLLTLLPEGDATASIYYQYKDKRKNEMIELDGMRWMGTSGGITLIAEESATDLSLDGSSLCGALAALSNLKMDKVIGIESWNRGQYIGSLQHEAKIFLESGVAGVWHGCDDSDPLLPTDVFLYLALDGSGKMEYQSGDALYEAQLAWYPTESGVRIVVINDSEGVILRSMGEILSFESSFLTADQMEIYLHQISNYWQSDMHLNNDVVISAYEQDENGNAVITSCYAETKRLTIPEEIDGLKIAGIGDGVFSGNMMIEQVVLPEGLQWIGNNAFQDCMRLTSAEFPSTLCEIGSNAFQNCTRLTSAEFPSALRKIGSNAFQDCMQLTSAEFPSALCEIGSNAFQNCLKLQQASFFGSVVLGERAFSHCDSLQNALFYGTEENVLGNYAFEDCAKLKIITLPDVRTTLGAGAFAGCKNLETAVLPAALESMGEKVFSGCTSLKQLTCSNRDGYAGIWKGRYSPDAYSSYDVYVFLADDGIGRIEFHFPLAVTQSDLLWYPTDAGFEALVDAEVQHYFGDLLQLRAFRESAGAIKIDGYEFTFQRISDFWQREDRISDVVLINAYEQDENGNAVITACFAETKQLTIPEEIDGLKIAGIGDGVFSGNMMIEQVVLPEGLQWIGNNAFQNCEKLERIEFPSTLNRIGESAFQNCTQLGSISFAHSVEIGNLAFSNCTQLAQASFVCDDSGVSTIGSNAFENCAALKTLELPNTLISIGEAAFSSCKSLETLSLPDSLETLGASAFFRCESLNEISLSPMLQRIEEDTFWLCTGLAQVIFPDGIEYIGNAVFYGCSQLRDVHLPENLKIIEASAFVDCDSLRSISIPENVERMGGADGGLIGDESLILRVAKGSYAEQYALDRGYETQYFDETIGQEVHVASNAINDFDYRIDGDGATLLYYAGADEYVEIPSALGGVPVVRIADKAFAENEDIKTVIVPESVQFIGAKAFFKCSELEKIVLPSGELTFGKYAFNNCPKVVLYVQAGSAAESYAQERTLNYDIL